MESPFRIYFQLKLWLFYSSLTIKTVNMINRGMSQARCIIYSCNILEFLYFVLVDSFTFMLLSLSTALVFCGNASRYPMILLCYFSTVALFFDSSISTDCGVFRLCFG